MKSFGCLIFIFLSFLFYFTQSQAGTSLGLSKKGLLYTLSSVYMEQLYKEPVPEDYFKVESLENPMIDSVETEVIPLNNEHSFYLTHKLIHPLNPRIPEHLVFIIPGFGSQSDGSTARLYLNFLSENGFAVASFDSPAAYRFIKNTSLSGTAGQQLNDAEMLYSLILNSVPYLEKKISKKFSFKKISVVGISLGGLNAHLISILSQNSEKASEKSQVQLYKTISINPPIRNSYSLSVLDKAIALYNKNPLSNKLVFGFQFLPYINTSDLNFESLENLTQQLVDSDINPHRALSMVGQSFNDTLEKAIQATSFRHPEIKFNSKSFLDYYYQVHKSENLMSHQNYSILDNNSIYSNISKLKTISNYYLITFDDDLLIDDIDINYIKKNLPMQSTIYSGGGGHLGGYYRKDFQKKLLEILE